jgi:ubiquinone/menaquinone biosynthesis C-methylase UbiE
MGCGSGRWAKFVSPQVGTLHCIDPSQVALNEAKNNLSNSDNCTFECASTSNNSLEESSQDFGYSLGVLHHIPDTYEALASCSTKLKSGAPFLLYLYYRFDNKPSWYAYLWKFSDFFRVLISKLPFKIKFLISQILALSVYWPLARLSKLLEKFKINTQNIPLSDYRNKPFYMLRTDALDRFGTRLEQRFTKDEIEQMLLDTGFTDIKFSNTPPFWTVVARKI